MAPAKRERYRDRSAIAPMLGTALVRAGSVTGQLGAA